MLKLINWVFVFCICIFTLSHVASSRCHNIMTKRTGTKRQNMSDTESCILSNTNLTKNHWVNTDTPQRLAVPVTLISHVV